MNSDNQEQYKPSKTLIRKEPLKGIFFYYLQAATDDPKKQSAL